MTYFRMRATGAYIQSDYALRVACPEVSLPVEIDAAAADVVGADVVTPTAPPDAPAGKMALESAPVQQGDAWVQAWELVDALPPVPIRKLPTISFRRRLTAPERAAIAVSAVTHLLGTPADAVLYVALDDAMSVNELDLDNPQLSQMLDLMTARALIAPGRKAVLLADVTPAELMP